MKLRIKTWCIFFWAVLIAEASHFSPWILTRAATTVGSSKRISNQIKSQEDQYLRNFSNRGAWAAVVHIQKPKEDTTKISLSSVILSSRTKELLSQYQNYLKDLTLRYHNKVVDYSSSLLHRSELYAKSVEYSKDIIDRSKLKVQEVLEQWEGYWADWWGENVDAETGMPKQGLLADLASLYLEAEQMIQERGWRAVIEKNGIQVWKMYLPSSREGSEYPLVKATGVIDAPPEKVLEMMIDSQRVKEYNKFSKGRDDLEVINDNTKIVWNRTWPPLCTKPHDFCSLLHFKRLEDASLLMITKATEHPGAPVCPSFQRSKILLGISIMKPLQGNPQKTELTTYNHVVSKGIPIMIADKVSVKTAADFINNVNKAFGEW
mmetsp:Transcript_14151/g.18532  ORF Transcript_14151/g.18532 Transcript_14151/m.18532 type:complete len:377 (+) Transcript_14151:186-1316(+)|eukprot:CAMPEP_0117757238 /NCGR_PEP_ID=MMETSP0947-20121206/14601_1 /TAXON_ID=44440 /ORGANISM="Chattonella subsalsa, Strain CCMP2191" /LENGTH=376 /DNA_ID=CAMNT_0005577071 /DNA_START=117 /DNA_END=1247 /DNA_ORIENTATION=+